MPTGSEQTARSSKLEQVLRRLAPSDAQDRQQAYREALRFAREAQQQGGGS